MLKLYNKEHKAVGVLTNIKDYKIEYVLSGEDLLEFSLSISDENIYLVEEEGYIRTKDNEYVIKAIDPGANFKRFTCNVNVEDLIGKAIASFDTSNNNINDTIRLAIAGTGWILADNNIIKRRTVRLTNTNALEVLREVRKVFRVDIRYDAINKIIYVYEQFGEDRGVYFSDELNLKSFSIPSDTYDYVTRLYPKGKDGLTIASINNGKEYIENFQYSNKVLELIWEDNRYTDVNSLKEDAEVKLDELSKPKRTYQASISDLAKQSEEYNFLDFFLGDTITLLSKQEKFRDKQRIVKYIQYPNDPSQNSCELGNTTLTFEELQQENEAKNNTVDAITSDNGTVDGSKVDSITTEQISDFEASVAKITDLTVVNAEINNLKAQNVTITGELNAVKGEFGTLKANVGVIDKLIVTHTAQINDLKSNSATITQLNAVSANIGTVEAEVGKIQTLVNGNLSSENIQSGGITSDKLTIANGFITNAMIASLDVSKVNAGDISTNKFRIKSDDGGIEIVGATQQFKDKNNKVRVQIGKDTQGNFNFIIKGEDGTTTLIDHTGVKAGAIADNLIISDMIASDSVGEKQINYSSFVTGFNKDTNTNTIKSTKIMLNNQNQTLDIAFNNLKTQADTTKSLTESHSTTIGVMQGQISTAINNTQIVKDGQTILLKDDYNRTVATIDSMKSTIGSHTSQINGLNSTVSTQGSSIEQLKGQIALKVEQTDITNAINNIQVGGRNFILNSNFIFGVEYWNYLDGVIDYQNKKCAYQTMNDTSGETFIASTRMYNEQISGKTITLSFLAACTPNMRSFEVYILSKKTDSDKDWDYAPVKQFVLNEKLTKYTWTYVMPSDIESFYIRFDNNSSTDGQNATLYITDVKFEIGNKATDWTPAPEDITSEIDTKIYTAKSEIKITTDAITQNVSNLTQTVSTKADGSTVSTLSNKVGSLETSVNGISGKVSSLETTTTSIDSKVKTAQNTADSAKTTATTANNTANANKNNITNLQGEVKTVKSNVASLDVNLQGITQRVSSTESTTTTLTTKVNTAQNTADNVNNKLEGLKIGGTNLLKGTKDFSTGKGNATIDTTKYYDFTVLKNNVPSTGYADMCQWTNLAIKPNTEYTLSFYAKASVNGAKHYSYLYPDAVAVGSNSSGATTNAPDGSIITTLTTEWKRYWVTWKTRSTLSGAKSIIPMRLYSSLATTDVTTYICGVHFEEGNRSTDWSPAPEDVSQDATNKSNQALTDAKNYTNTQITTVNNKVASIQTDLNGITSRVTNTENNIKTTNNNVTNLTNRVATAESKITESAITNTIKKNFYTKSETDSQITSKGYQTASQVQQTVNGLEVKVQESGGYNLIKNSTGASQNTRGWTCTSGATLGVGYNDSIGSNNRYFMYLDNGTATSERFAFSSRFKLKPNTKYTFVGYFHNYTTCPSFDVYVLSSTSLDDTDTSGAYTNVHHLINSQNTNGSWKKFTATFTTPASTRSGYIRIDNNGYNSSGTNSNRVHWNALLLVEGELELPWSPHPSEIYDGITTIDKDGITVSNSNSSTYTQIDNSSFRVENNTGGTVAEFSQNSKIPNLNAGIITANEVYANNIARKSTYVKNYYVAGGYGNDKEGAGGSWNNPCKTVQYVLDNYIEDILDYDVNIYVGESVPGWTCKSKSGKGVISFLIENDCIVRDPLYLDNCTNRVVVNGYAEKKGTFMTGIVVTGCHNFDIGWVSFRGKNWAHSKGSCNVIIRDGSKGIVRFNDFNGCSFAIIVENNSEIWMYQNRGSDITHYIGIGAYATIYGMRSGSDVCPDFTGYYYADAGHANLYHIHDGANYTKTPSIGWSPSYTPTQKTQTWSFNKIWSDETLHGWSDRQELIQGYASTWNTGRWTGYMQMTDGMTAIRSAISGGTNLSGRIYIQRTSSSGNSTGSKLCLYASDGTLITNSTSINRSQGVWVSLSSSIIQKIQSGAITYFYLKADSNNTATYFKCESNAKIEITYTK